MLSRVNEFEDNEVHELPPWLKSLGLTYNAEIGMADECEILVPFRGGVLQGIF